MVNNTAPPQEKPSYFSDSRFQIEEDKRNDICEFGGLSLVHKYLIGSGYFNLANDHLKLISQPKPYTDADHLYNLTYNFFAGNSSILGVERFQENEGWKKFLNVNRLPDPTTQGDYLKRFDDESINALQELQYQIRLSEWNRNKKELKKRIKKTANGVGILDCDSSIFGTYGNCKEGANFSYTGTWGFHPLLIHLRNSNELLYIGLREGQVYTSNGVFGPLWDAITFVKPHFKELRLQVDSGFYSKEMVRFCDELGVKLILKVKKYNWLKEEISKIAEADWTNLYKPSMKGGKQKIVRRKKRGNIKMKVLLKKQKEKKKKYTYEICEQWAEFDYQPYGWVKPYRFVVKRKLKRKLGTQSDMFDFYEYEVVASDSELPAHILLQSYNNRAGQENLIEDFKNGLKARRVPCESFHANWAYLIIAGLAWNIKIWMSYLVFRDNCHRVEWRTFLLKWILIPGIIVKKSRGIIFRTKRKVEGFHQAFFRINKLKFA